MVIKVRKENHLWGGREGTAFWDVGNVYSSIYVAVPRIYTPVNTLQDLALYWVYVIPQYHVNKYPHIELIFAKNASKKN